VSILEAKARLYRVNAFLNIVSVRRKLLSLAQRLRRLEQTAANHTKSLYNSLYEEVMEAYELVSLAYMDLVITEDD